MKVYALVGKSGTGKSHHSMQVAAENRIDYIIDDGLLISDNRIIAGKSAKAEANKIASVYRAIFNDPDHAAEVRAALEREQAETLLLIGTSEKMVNRIGAALDVLPIDKIIHIEDVATPEEIKMAYDMRNKHGKHVIPVPTFELKRQLSGYFIDPINLLFKRKGETVVEEKSVMRPVYSYLGEYKISPKAIVDICEYEAYKFDFVNRVMKVKSSTTPNRYLIIEIDISMNFPCRVKENAAAVSEKIKEVIEDLTAINVQTVRINVKDLKLSDKK